METKSLLESQALGAGLSSVKGDKVALPNSVDQIIFQCVVSAFTAGSLTAIVEHSLDGTNWCTAISFTAAKAATGIEFKFPTTSVGQFVRSSVITAALTDLTAEIKVGYRSRK